MAAHWKRYLTCMGCGREIVAFASHWACPYCGADNKQPDMRGRETSVEESGQALPAIDGDRDVMIDRVWESEAAASHDEVMSCRIWAGNTGLGENDGEKRVLRDV